MKLPFACPGPNTGWKIDWDAIDSPPHTAWIEPMKTCPQDPVYHAEGDVWTHTKMVCEALAGSASWRALPAHAREVVFAACLLHDIAKPLCTRVENGRIRQPGHSPKGALMTRTLLWRHHVPFALREQVVALVRTHQVPFFLIDSPSPTRRLIIMSQTARCDHLAQVTRADALGRICEDQQTLLDNIELFETLSREQDCADHPWAFANPHARFLYMRRKHRDPHYAAHVEHRCEVVMTAGLPGCGKTHFAEHELDLPLISLDAIRRELKHQRTGDQGPVLRLARERAREYLRKGQSFIWGATNLRRDLRARLIDLFANYGARIRIIHVEAPPERLHRQNNARTGDDRVPAKAIERMLNIWELPDITEAHQVDYVVYGERGAPQVISRI